MRAFSTYLVVMFLTAACGGGGGGSEPSPAPEPPPPPTTTPPPPVSDSNAEGVWKGTFSADNGDTGAVLGFASSAGELRLLFPDTGKQYFGPLTVSENSVEAELVAVAAPGQLLAGGASEGDVSVTGDIEESVTFEGGYSGADGSGTFELDYEPAYERTAAAAPVAGSWSSSAATHFPADNDPDIPDAIGLKSEANGSLTGGDTFGCDYSGTFAAPVDGFNVFPVSVAVSSCGPLDGVYDGLAIVNDFEFSAATMYLGASLPGESLLMRLVLATNLSAAGVWSGNLAPQQGGAENAEAIVSETGEVRIVREDGTYLVAAGDITGNFLKASGEIVAAEGRIFADGTSRGPVEIRARIAEKNTIAGREIGHGESVAIQLDFDSTFDLPSMPQDLAGKWAFTDETGRYTELAFDSAGSVTGADSAGCQHYGVAEAADESSSAYRLTLETAGCETRNGAAEGLLGIRNPGGPDAEIFVLSSGESGAFYGRFLQRPATPSVEIDPRAASPGSDVSGAYEDARLSTVDVVSEVDGESVIVPLQPSSDDTGAVFSDGEVFLDNERNNLWAADRRFGSKALRIDFASTVYSLAVEVSAVSTETVILQLYDVLDQRVAQTVVQHSGRFPVHLFAPSESDARYALIAPASGSEISLVVAELEGGSMPPQIDIQSPGNSAQFEVGESITFAASALNSAGQSLAGSVTWTSDVEGGVIGYGSPLTAALQQVGTHTVEATVTDGFGVTASDSISVDVVEQPVVSNPGLPNIVIFMSDDLGYGDVGIYNPESRVSTPNLDALAQAGMRFTDAHTPASKCAPTRYATVTGNYQWRGRRSYGVFHYKGGSQVLPGQLTIGDLLQRKGYETAYIGKVHMGGDFYRKGSNQFATQGDSDFVVDFSRPMRNGPMSYGFANTYLLLSGIQGPPYAFFRDDRLVGDPDDLIMWEAGMYNGSQINNDGIGMPDWDSREAGPELIAEALEFLDSQHAFNQGREDKRPFFLYYNSQSAHAPYTPPASMLGNPIEGASGMDSRHGDMIYEVDVAFGLIMESLEAKELLADTLVIFTSDNGGNTNSNDRSQGHDSVGGLRGHKRLIWEGGHRVPFIARWSDGTNGGSRIPRNQVRDQLISVHDLMATIATIVEEPIPIGQANDSFDYSDVFLGRRNDSAPVRDHLIMQADLGDEIWAYREGRWKLVMDDDYSVVGFFDLDADLAEEHDLSNSAPHADRISQLHTRFMSLRGADRTAPIP